MMKKILLASLLFSSGIAIAQKESPAVKFAALITPQSMKEKLSILAGAEMEGRETGMPGERKAAAFIETHFKNIGLKPGNGTSYQQYFPVYVDELSRKQLRVNGRNFEWDKDFNFSFQGLSSGEWIMNDLVFVSYGIVDKTANINDFEGLDVKGKIVVFLDGSPEGYKAPTTSNTIAPNVKIGIARGLGAAGVFMVSKDFPRKTAAPLRGNIYMNKPTAPPFLIASISEELASALVGRSSRLSNKDLAALQKGKYISEIKIASLKNTTELQTSNVIGIIEGTDKKDEYVFMTGHHDHLGKRGDIIYYGADDDGSGTVGVMQMAEAFAAAAKKGDKPRRTLVFMTVSGEEKGLWGSQYYSEHPIFPMDKTSVDLNTDMIGRVDTERKTADTLNYIYVIGHDKLSSDLPIINEAANLAHTKITLDYKFDDPKDVNRIYYRSDHYNFARKGVPVLFFYDGMLLADYHQPGDTVDKINFELMEKRAKLVFHTAWEIANRNEMLKRDIPLTMPAR
ncbi:MAG: M28 family peptidase [Sphingobacteriia bacterium]|jgi:hypothetical protein|nr:MAG: M28 family peptidase [Sphingobacteriia bacterium]